MTQKASPSKRTLLFLVVIVVTTIAIGLAVLSSRIGQLHGVGPVTRATLHDFTRVTAIEPAQGMPDIVLVSQNGVL
jgi:hypothetical protein